MQIIDCIVEMSDAPSALPLFTWKHQGHEGTGTETYTAENNPDSANTVTDSVSLMECKQLLPAKKGL